MEVSSQVVQFTTKVVEGPKKSCGAAICKPVFIHGDTPTFGPSE